MTETNEQVADQLEALADEANSRSRYSSTDFRWVEQAVVPILPAAFGNERVKDRALWSARLLLEHKPDEAYRTLERHVNPLASLALKLVEEGSEEVAALAKKRPRPASKSPQRAGMYADLLACVDETLLVPLWQDQLEGLRTGLDSLTQPMTADEYLLPLPVTQSPSDPQDSWPSFQCQAGHGPLVQWGDSLSRLFVLRLQALAILATSVARVLLLSCKEEPRISLPSTSSAQAFLDESTRHLEALYYFLIEEPQADGREGLAVLAKIYMLFHYRGHPLLTSLSKSLARRSSLQDKWRQAGDVPLLLTCVAAGLRAAARVVRNPDQGKPENPGYPLPLSASWEDLELTLIKGEGVEVKTGKAETKTFTLHDMGLATANGKPNFACGLLLQLANSPDGLSLEKRPDGKLNDLKTAKNDLSKKLKAFFHREDDPFQDARKRHAYVPRFKVQADQRVTISTSVVGWSDISLLLAKDGRLRIVASIDERRGDGFGEEQGEERRQLDRVVSFEELGLASAGDTPDKCGKLLKRLIAGGGNTQAPRDDALMQRLARTLKDRLPDVTGEPLDWKDGVWRPAFNTDSDAD